MVQADLLANDAYLVEFALDAVPATTLHVALDLMDHFHRKRSQ
jgi:hypothetical protein